MKQARILVAGWLVISLAIASIGPRPALSQPNLPTSDGATPAKPPSTPVTAPANPSSAVPTTAPVSDDDELRDTATALAGLPRPPSDPVQRKQWLAAQLDAAIASRPTLSKASLGATIIDATTGAPLWSYQADEPRNLASVTKLLTTTAALHFLGGSFRWRTTLYADGLDPKTGTIKGALIVRGRGDPTLSQHHLAELAQRLRAQGIRNITGKLIFDDSYFDDVVDPPRFADQPNERAGFRAPVGAASLERNAITIIVTAQRAGEGLADIRLDPALSDYVRLVEKRVVTVSKGRTRVTVTSDVTPTRIDLHITGQIAVGDEVEYIRRRVDDPDRFFADALRIALAKAGIRIRAKAFERAPVPTTAVVLAEHESEPLAAVIRDMNKASDNYVAETVLKTIGAETLPAPTTGKPRRPATWNDGLDAVRSYLTTVGLTVSKLRIDNGSGLFDASSVSAHDVAKLLAAAWKDFRIGPDLVSALSQAGVDGTLRHRLQDPMTRGRVRAKTGTLAQSSALAGFAAADSARPLIFVALANRLPAGSRPDARTWQDTVAALATLYVQP